MLDPIPERDWKILRELRAIALERFCQRVLAEVERITSDSEKSSHARYLEALRLLKDRDRDLAAGFDDVRRSNAWLRLACIKSYGLLTDEELARFGPETQDFLRALLKP